MFKTKITSNGAKKVAQAIQVSTTPQKLDFSVDKKSNSGASFISDGLKINKSLKEFNMSKTEIIIAGAMTIAEAIWVNTTLWKLDLSLNKISDGATWSKIPNMTKTKVSSEGAKIIGQAMK